MRRNNVTPIAGGPGRDDMPEESAIRGRVWVRMDVARGDEEVQIGLRGRSALIWATDAAMEMAIRGWAASVYELRADGEEVRAFRAAPGDQ